MTNFPSSGIYTCQLHLAALSLHLIDPLLEYLQPASCYGRQYVLRMLHHNNGMLHLIDRQCMALESAQYSYRRLQEDIE